MDKKYISRMVFRFFKRNPYSGHSDKVFFLYVILSFTFDLIFWFSGIKQTIGNDVGSFTWYVFFPFVIELGAAIFNLFFAYVILRYIKVHPFIVSLIYGIIYFVMFAPHYWLHRDIKTAVLLLAVPIIFSAMLNNYFIIIIETVFVCGLYGFVVYNIPKIDTFRLRKVNNTILLLYILFVLIVLGVGLLLMFFMRDEATDSYVLNKNKQQMRNHILSRMGTEIKAPVNAVLGMNEMILRESKVKEALECSESIESAGRSLLLISEDIDDLVNIDNNGAVTNNVEYDLREAVLDSFEALNVMNFGSDVTLRVENNLNIPTRYIGDVKRIKRVIVNLVNNFMKNKKEGYVTLSVNARINNRQEEAVLLFTVRDLGDTLAEEEQDFLKGGIFSEREVMYASNFALSITESIARLLNGNVNIKKEENVRNILEVSIPQTIADKTPIGDIGVYISENSEKVKKTEIYHKIPGAKVLVIDDAPIEHEIIKAFLKDYEIEVDDAFNGIEGLEMIQNTKYDLILMDLHMPKMSGLDTFKAIREKEKEDDNHKVPVILMTADDDRNAIAGYITMGFSDFLPKPVDSEVLGKVICDNYDRQNTKAKRGE
ncbi:MAG: response regulator [Lachnospiraceae bacterium]|nr:response regulator [Lachnospiraceae bacterium]